MIELRLLLATLAAWANRRQASVITYLRSGRAPFNQRNGSAGYSSTTIGPRRERPFKFSDTTSSAE